MVRKIKFVPENCALSRMVNPVKSNGMSLSYQLDQTISVLKIVGVFFFHFYSNFDKKNSKQTFETLIRCCTTEYHILSKIANFRKIIITLLTHINPASFLWDIGKHSRPRSDATGSLLFAYIMFY